MKFLRKKVTELTVGDTLVYSVMIYGISCIFTAVVINGEEIKEKIQNLFK